jgi:signal transduction histidine kinase
MAESGRVEKPDVEQACRLLSELAERDPGNRLIFDLARQYCRARAIQEMASAVHDLRSPNCSTMLNLATARTLVERLMEPGLTNEQIAGIAQALSACVKAMEVASELEKDILDRVTPPPEGTRMEPRVTSLRHVFERLQSVMCAQCFPEQLVAVQEIPDVRVAASVGDLLRVLINLLRNAVAAILGSSRPRVEISSWATPVAAFVRVEDNGCGMDADRTRNGPRRLVVTNQVAGGLGLLSVRLCVERWGGQMDVRSTRGEGTEIVFSVPLATEAGDAIGETD